MISCLHHIRKLKSFTCVFVLLPGAVTWTDCTLCIALTSVVHGSTSILCSIVCNTTEKVASKAAIEAIGHILTILQVYVLLFWALWFYICEFLVCSNVRLMIFQNLSLLSKNLHFSHTCFNLLLKPLDDSFKVLSLIEHIFSQKQTNTLCPLKSMKNFFEGCSTHLPEHFIKVVLFIVRLGCSKQCRVVEHEQVTE